MVDQGSHCGPMEANPHVGAAKRVRRGPTLREGWLIARVVVHDEGEAATRHHDVILAECTVHR